MLPAPQGQEPRWQRQADESSRPPKDALRLKEGRQNSAGGSGRAGDEPQAGYQDPHPTPAAVPCSSPTFSQARPWALGSCLESPPKLLEEQNWEFCFAVKPSISLRARHTLLEQWCPQECHQGRGQLQVEHQGDVPGHLPWWNGTQGTQGTTDSIRVIATNQGPTGHLATCSD